MSSVEPPIQIKTKLPDILPTVQLERYVTVGANHVRRCARCPLINNEVDPELACRVVEEFMDIATDTRLHLDDGPLKFEFFRQCLSGQARAHWDVAAAAQADNSNAAFDAALVVWFSNYFKPTAFHDQKQYFLQATKAFSMTVKETATRVDEIIRYMGYMPGAVDPVYSAVEKKMVLYRLMRSNWKTNFDASGNVITDAGFTWNNLITYMAAQEKKENKNLPPGNHRNPGSQFGGRGFSPRGGRGFGGRGFGRGRGGRSSYGAMRRSADYQGGPPTQRFRPNGYGQGGRGYAPAPYGNGYGGGRYGYGYGNYNNYGRGFGHAGGYSGNGFAGGRGGFGRGNGHGPPRGRGQEARALAADPGYVHRNPRSTRSGGVYVVEGSEAPAESFDSGEQTQASDPPQDPNPHSEEMYYGEGENGGDYDPYGGYEYGYNDQYEGYGDY